MRAPYRKPVKPLLRDSLSSPNDAKAGPCHRLGKKKGQKVGQDWISLALLRCSPDGIRTRATALRGRRARPLHNGAVHPTRPLLSGRCRCWAKNTEVVVCLCALLGYQDSNLD